MDIDEKELNKTSEILIGFNLMETPTIGTISLLMTLSKALRQVMLMVKNTTIDVALQYHIRMTFPQHPGGYRLNSQSMHEVSNQL